jgi:predicted Zn-dependent protease
MSQDRISVFKSMVEADPENAMIWYGLASEYSKLDCWKEAEDALNSVVRINPDYTAAYQMLGTALLNQGKLAEARAVWNEGLSAADRTGAWKARQHLEGLLKGNVGPSALCTD